MTARIGALLVVVALVVGVATYTKMAQHVVRQRAAEVPAAGRLAVVPSDAQIRAAAVAAGYPVAPADWLTETTAQLATHGWAIVNDVPASDQKVAHVIRKIMPIRTQGAWAGTWQAGPGYISWWVPFQRTRTSGPTYRYANTVNFAFWWNSPYGAVVFDVSARHVTIDRVSSGAAAVGHSTFPSDRQYTCATGVTCHNTIAEQQFSLNPCYWHADDFGSLIPFPGSETAAVGINMWPNSTIYYATGLIGQGCQ